MKSGKTTTYLIGVYKYFNSIKAIKREGKDLVLERIYHLLSLILLCILFCAICSSCGKETEKRRVWTPQDHGHTNPVQAPIQDPTVTETEKLETKSEQTGSVHQEAAAIQALYRVHCAKCHGSTGGGDGVARPKGIQLPDFSDREFHAAINDDQLKDAIRHGRKMMPGLGDDISDESLFHLIQLIRNFKKTRPHQ